MGEGVAEGVGIASVVSSVTVVVVSSVGASVVSLFVASVSLSVVKALPSADMPSPS